jgi:type I restriction enzyme M protein
VYNIFLLNIIVGTRPKHAVAVTPLKDINIDWLYHQLVNMNLNQYATGTAQPGLSVENLKAVSVAVPTLSIQQKIVAQIQKIEEKINTLQTSINNTPQQKEAVLKKYL